MYTSDEHLRALMRWARAALDGDAAARARCERSIEVTPVQQASPSALSPHQMSDKECLAVARAICERQAKDDALWIDAATAPEAYLQRALRSLTAAVEGNSVDLELYGRWEND